MRLPLIAGNWKMHKTAAEAAAFAREFLPRVAGVEGVEIVLAPPFTAIRAVSDAVRGAGIGVAAQNVHHAPEGAFTGEVSIGMAREAGATHAIVGHSERRQFFAETDGSVNLKTKALLAAGLVPIVCVGETLAEREGGRTFEVVERQLRLGLEGIAGDTLPRAVLAYEPVWAIGTGRTATPDQAEEVHAFLRKTAAAAWGDAAAIALRILYGGSVKPDNIADLMRREDVDGALVGGASLAADAFARIVRYR